MAANASGWEFGDYLRTLRSRLGLSFGQVIIRLRGIGVETDRSTLHRYESGERRSPDAVVLWGLAKVYKRPVEELIETLSAATIGSGRTATETVRSRLTDEQLREEKVLQFFRSSSVAVQREILELLEFKASRARGGADTTPQRDAAPPAASFRSTRRRGVPK